MRTSIYRKFSQKNSIPLKNPELNISLSVVQMCSPILRINVSSFYFMKDLSTACQLSYMKPIYLILYFYKFYIYLFVNYKFKQLCQKYFVKHFKCPIQDHRDNGKVERLIKTVNERLRTNKKVVIDKNSVD